MDSGSWEWWGAEVHPTLRLLNGLRLTHPLTSEVVEWRDEDFQRVDSETLERLPDAQRHARNRKT